MSHIHNNGRNETLDPEDWQAFAEMGQQMLDDMLAYLHAGRGSEFTRFVWQSCVYLGGNAGD